MSAGENSILNTSCPHSLYMLLLEAFNRMNAALWRKPHFEDHPSSILVAFGTFEVECVRIYSGSQFVQTIMPTIMFTTCVYA
eukprot:1765431-Pyramimonas_sp.AAC.1